MKTLLTLFVLLFSSSVMADDISDFEIERMSLGDRIDDYFPGREIAKNITSKYNHLSDKFYAAEFYQHSSFKKYDVVEVIMKQNDDGLFTIRGMSGIIFYEENIEDCYIEKEKIIKKLTTIFKDAKIEGPTVLTHPDDATGLSKYEVNNFHFDWGFARVTCYDMSDSMQIIDVIAVDIFFQEVDDWLSGIN